MTFEELTTQINSLSAIPNVDFSIIGYSLLSYPITCAHIGSYSGAQVLLEGAIHAREWVTAPLLVELCKYYATQTFDGGMYFIPMSNPDGVHLVLDGADWLPCEKLKKYLVTIVNDGSNNFDNWKANANAVDENVNFNALWGGGQFNVTCPAPANFIGYYPNSEREVRTLEEFTLKNKPDITLSYHTRGELIYYGFETLTESEIERDKIIAEQIAQVTGYSVVKTEKSTGGYSDWVSDNLRVPAFTIEVGSNEWAHPIGEEYLPIIFEQNKDVPKVALDSVTPKVNKLRFFRLFK